MIDDLHFLKGPIGPGAVGGGKPTTVGPKAAPQGPSFAEVFQQTLDTKLKVSAHAQQRLQSRKIDLTQADWDKINQGVDRAAAKGAKEALVLSDKAALVVSVRNRTVITAVDPQNLKENVFTNIDSAVIV
jgi:flagellar operon protein